MNFSVLMLVFNRPATTARVFEAMRQARPSRLYLAADGPRPGRPDEALLCAEVRRTVQKIDWTCETKTLFRDENLGCKAAVAGAIDWFFEHEEEGIIIEDDCLPHQAFFPFCAELLERYRHDERVFALCGDNKQDGRPRGDAGYYFSRYMHVWGWASWRRAWARYDVQMRGLPEFIAQHGINRVFSRWHERRYWEQLLSHVARGSIDTWDFQWQYAVWKNNGLTVIPNGVLVSNICDGTCGTHTTVHKTFQTGRPHDPPEFPLRHPASIAPDRPADRYTSDHAYRIPTLSSRILRRISLMREGSAGGRS